MENLTAGASDKSIRFSADTRNVGSSVRVLEQHVREVSDFPKAGISFKDITPLIENGDTFHASVERLATAIEDLDFDRILSAEARGFVFGTALAYRFRKGLVLARKQGKLPRKTISASYNLEYGSATLQIHTNSIFPGARVLVVDDLLATGGTAHAMCELVENAGGEVAGTAFLIELAFLGGRDRLAPHQVSSLLCYKTP